MLLSIIFFVCCFLYCKISFALTRPLTENIWRKTSVASYTRGVVAFGTWWGNLKEFICATNRARIAQFCESLTAARFDYFRCRSCNFKAPATTTTKKSHKNLFNLYRVWINIWTLLIRYLNKYFLILHSPYFLITNAALALAFFHWFQLLRLSEFYSIFAPSLSSF